jgi:hypothetical protein
MSYADYLNKLEQQGYVCAVCQKEETLTDRAGDVRRLSVDHNHVTGKVRGLLCGRCNLALGNIQDSIPTLKAAITYLEKYNE